MIEMGAKEETVDLTFGLGKEEARQGISRPSIDPRGVPVPWMLLDSG